ncbi:RPA family protein, partial [Halobellus rufus]|uniref:RPA family protein n=1 Tax=Halobellus rufus TaxID=1448860 RepID=UPI00373FCD74
MSDAVQGREVARRLFAAEFDDATLSYSEGDDERAPNYVVTPTGARVNRLFAVGALTEVEQVNEEIVRGRVADPTGVFVTYAGQYQPDAMGFLDRATPPCFVSLTGKARTYQPEDSDRIFTSVRPESLNEVDADTRDRWVVAAAEATLERVATMAAALELDVRGDDLTAALEARGVDSALAQGVALA